MKLIADAVSIERTIARIAHEILEKNRGVENLALIGIQTRGVILARRIQKAVADISQKTVPLGILDINLYRDDLARLPLPAGQAGVGRQAAEQPVIRKTEISFDLDNQTLVLVDDVLYTGRTIRAALDAIVDFGRPRRIELAVLIDRGHRELPIRADFVGKNIPTSENETVQVRFSEIDRKDEVVVEQR